MKNIIKEIIIVIIGFLSLSLMKSIILLIFITTDENFYSSSIQKDVNVGDLAVKLIYVNIIPIILYLLIGSYIIYRYINKLTKTIFVISLSILLYYILNFTGLMYFVDGHKNKVIFSICLQIALIIVFVFLLKRYESKSNVSN